MLRKSTGLISGLFKQLIVGYVKHHQMENCHYFPKPQVVEIGYVVLSKQQWRNPNITLIITEDPDMLQIPLFSFTVLNSWPSPCSDGSLRNLSVLFQGLAVEGSWSD